MKKVLIIGDSHAASLSLGSQSVIVDYNVDLHFLVGAGPSRSCIKFGKSGISIDKKPTWPKCQDTAIYDSQYDMLLNSFNAIATSNLLQYENYSSIVLVGGEFFTKEWEFYAINTTNYSNAFLKELFYEYRQGYQSVWLKGCKHVSDFIDIYSLTPPLVNEICFSTSGDKAQEEIGVKPNQCGPGNIYFGDTEDFITLGISTYGAKYVPLPKQLLTESQNATKGSFKTDARMDRNHLNKIGGEIRLRNLLELICNV